MKAGRLLARYAWLGMVLALAVGLAPGAVRAAPPHPEGGSDQLIPLPGPTPLAEEDAPAKRIEVDISQQRLVAWEGDQRVRVLVVSTGDEDHPTVRGEFKIKQKFEQIDLIGQDYYYRNVPYVMMYSRPFYIHAAPWRTRFGTRSSRGCVTLSAADAAWLFDWAPIGTPVAIHW